MPSHFRHTSPRKPWKSSARRPAPPAAALVELLNPRQQQPERFGFDVGERQRNRVQAAAALLAIGPAAIPIPE